jgi:uncharacterized membrane protein
LALLMLMLPFHGFILHAMCKLACLHIERSRNKWFISVWDRIWAHIILESLVGVGLESFKFSWRVKASNDISTKYSISPHSTMLLRPPRFMYWDFYLTLINILVSKFGDFTCAVLLCYAFVIWGHQKLHSERYPCLMLLALLMLMLPFHGFILHAMCKLACLHIERSRNNWFNSVWDRIWAHIILESAMQWIIWAAVMLTITIPSNSRVWEW